jgi:hypothetical protein
VDIRNPSLFSAGANLPLVQQGREHGNDVKNPFLKVGSWHDAVANIARIGIGRLLYYLVSSERECYFLDKRAQAQDVITFFPELFRAFAALSLSEQANQLRDGSALYETARLAAGNRALVKEFKEVLELCERLLTPEERQHVLMACEFPLPGSNDNSQKGNLMTFVYYNIPNFDAMDALKRFVDGAFGENTEARVMFEGNSLIPIAENDMVSSIFNKTVSLKEREHNAVILFSRILCYGCDAFEKCGADARKAFSHALAFFPGGMIELLIDTLKNADGGLDKFVEIINPEVDDDDNGNIYAEDCENILLYSALCSGKRSDDYANTLLLFKALSKNRNVSAAQRRKLNSTIRVAENLRDIGFDIVRNRDLSMATLPLKDAKRLHLRRGDFYAASNCDLSKSRFGTKIPYRSLGWLPNLETVIVEPSAAIEPYDIEAILTHGVNENMVFHFTEDLPSGFTQETVANLKARFEDRIIWSPPSAV